MPRLTRSEQQARTRAELLKSAERMFLKKGFHATGIPELAEEAGYSKGAVYANFEGKDDLFLQVVEERFDSPALEIEPTIDPSLSLEEQAVAAGEGFWQVFLGDPEWSLLLMEYATHAARHPEIRDRFAQRNRRLRREMAALIDRHLEEFGLTSPIPSDQLAAILFSLGSGIILEKLTDPEGISDSTFTAALELIFNGILHTPVGSRE